MRSFVKQYLFSVERRVKLECQVVAAWQKPKVAAFRQGLPAALMADMNNDGVIDSYWDNNLTLRHMDDANRVDNPRYQRSWN